MRRPISVTIEEDNLLWLKAQAAASAKGSLSAVLDRLVGEARAQGQHGTASQSVAGTIDLPADDSELDGASSYVRGLLEQSLRRPMVVKESPPRRRSRSRTRRG